MLRCTICGRPATTYIQRYNEAKRLDGSVVSRTPDGIKKPYCLRHRTISGLNHSYLVR